MGQFRLNGGAERRRGQTEEEKKEEEEEEKQSAFGNISWLNVIIYYF